MTDYTVTNIISEVINRLIDTNWKRLLKHLSVTVTEDFIKVLIINFKLFNKKSLIINIDAVKEKKIIKILLLLIIYLSYLVVLILLLTAVLSLSVTVLSLSIFILLLLTAVLFSLLLYNNNTFLYYSSDTDNLN